MTTRCDYKPCNRVIKNPKPGQHYCQDKCRSADWREKKLPGQVTSLRKLKNGDWSVTVHFRKQPGINIGSAVRLETTPDSRSNAFSEENGQ